MRFFGAFAMFAGLIVLCFAAVELQRDRTLSARGVRIRGVVVGRDRDVDTSSKPRKESYYLSVGYGSARQRFSVSRYVYDHSPTGSGMDVVYDPAQPSSARLAFDLSSGSAYLYPGLFGLGLLGAGVGFFIASTRKQPEESMDLDDALSRARRG